MRKIKVNICKELFNRINKTRIKLLLLFINKWVLISISAIIITYDFGQKFLNINRFYLIEPNKFYLNNYFKTKDHLNFNVSSINFSKNSKDKLIKIEYLISFYDNDKNIIIPSDLTLYYNYSIFCYFKEIKKNNIILSIAYVFENLHYKCIELVNSEEIFLGIMIKNIENNEFKVIKLFLLNNIYNKYNKLISNQFDCLTINKEFNDLFENIKNKNKSIINTIDFKSLYIKKPICNTKSNINLNYNQWNFINLYNNYSCFCTGFKCLYNIISQNCKYFLYLNIIDNNEKLFNKTDYLFSDFIYEGYSSDDTYPVFQEMIKLNLSAHYLTQYADIYRKYCGNKKRCLSIIPVKNNAIIDGDFLEKYLTLFLKLKAAITGATFFYINNLFYHIDYIQHICVGHGVSFFKHFLYQSDSYYGNHKYNKILIPPSEKLINMAKAYNWTDNNIIKINLPRWEIYDTANKNLKIYNSNIIRTNSIFIMFTWRKIKKNKNISSHYINNILEILNNKLLNKCLSSNNITLYFSLHHQSLQYKTNFKFHHNVKYISDIQISSVLKSTNLIVTDFSSIIFDIIYRKKPFIIFIPDANDSDITNIYSEEYSTLIKDIKNGLIKFENIFFNVNETVNKIIYYVKKNFRLETKLNNFYNSFGFKHEKSIKNFIDYLINI